MRYSVLLICILLNIIGCKNNHSEVEQLHKTESQFKRPFLEFEINPEYSVNQIESYRSINYALQKYKDDILLKSSKEVNEFSGFSNPNLDFVLLKSLDMITRVSNNGIRGEKLGSTYYIELLPVKQYTKRVQKATYIEYGDSTKFPISEWYEIILDEYNFYNDLYNYSESKARYIRSKEL